MRENGAPGKACAEMVHQRFIGNAMKAVAPNSVVEVVAGESEARCDLRNGLMKSVVETYELRGRGGKRLGGCDKLQRLRNMQGCEVGCRAQLVYELRRDDLMADESWPSVYHAMAYSYRACVDMLADCLRKNAERVALRLVNTLLL